jgi:glyoxylase-like metal-dependent hydrolase (beta-lactamase superfamily II)
VVEGATIVTHQVHRPFYEQAWASPRTLRRDRLAASAKPAVFETFTGKHVLTDGRRSIEIHELQGSGHSDGFAVVYLPTERVLIQADAYTPGAAGAPLPSPPSPFTINLFENVERLKLNVRTVAGLHGPRLVPIEELRTLAAPQGRTN